MLEDLFLVSNSYNNNKQQPATESLATEAEEEKLREILIRTITELNTSTIQYRKRAGGGGEGGEAKIKIERKLINK